MGGGAHLRARAREEQGREALHPARRPALRQRTHPHRPRLQQDPQGLRQQVPCAARLLHAVRARLGLPRPADRAHGGEDARSREDGADRPAHAAAPLPRVGREVRRRAARGLQAPGRERRLGASVPHVHAELRGRQRRGIQEDVPGRLGVPRPQAHPLVQALPHRAGRGRDRVRRRDVALHLREVQAGRHARPVRGRGRRRRRLRAHLDHDALDAAGEHGRVARARRRLRDGGGGRLEHDHGARLGGAGGRDRGLGGLRPRVRLRRRARRAQGPRVHGAHVHVPRPPGPEGHAHLRRPRHAGHGHRLRAHRSRSRPGRLPGGARVRRPAAHAGGRQRALHRRGGAVRRPGHRRGQPAHHRLAARAGHAGGGKEDHAQLPALLALPRAGHLPRHRPVVRVHGQERPARGRARGHRAWRGMDPRLG